MSIKYKIVFSLFFILSLSTAVMGISILAKNGGPCNGGITLFFLGFIFIICSLLLLSPFAALIKKSAVHNNTALTISVIVFVIWTICMMFFTDHNALAGELYLIPFELFSIVTIALMIKFKGRAIQ
jgi:uncharacterized membrane protein YhaH (DUF805 family)